MRHPTCLSLLMFSFLPGLIQAQQGTKKNYELVEEAERFARAGDREQSLALLNECLKHYPGYFEAYTARGAIRELLNDAEGAVTDYSIFLEQFPLDPEALLSRGVLRYKIGHYTLAREDFVKLLTASSTETNAIFFKTQTSVNDRSPVLTTAGAAHHPYAYHYLGLIEMRLNNMMAAIDHFSHAIALNGQDANSYANRGQAKEMSGDTTAVNDYLMALQLYPEHAVAQHCLEAWEAKHASATSTEQRLTKTIRLDSTLIYPYLQRGLTRLGNNDYAGALEDFDNAIERDPKDPEIWLARGLAREKLLDYTGAFSDYTHAIDLNDAFAKAWVNRGNVLLKQKRYEDALEDYTVSLIYYPDNAAAYYNRGLAHMYLKKYEAACEDLALAETFGSDVDMKLKQAVCAGH